MCEDSQKEVVFLGTPGKMSTESRFRQLEKLALVIGLDILNLFLTFFYNLTVIIKKILMFCYYYRCICLNQSCAKYKDYIKS